MVTSQMMRSGSRRRASSAPAAPSLASWISNPCLRSAQLVAWRKRSSSSMTRMRCMSVLGEGPRLENLVHRGQELFGGERFEEESGVGQLLGHSFVFTQTAGRNDAYARIQTTERINGGGTVEERHDDVGHDQIDVIFLLSKDGHALRAVAGGDYAVAVFAEDGLGDFLESTFVVDDEDFFAVAHGRSGRRFRRGRD